MEEKNKLTGLASMLGKQAEPNNQRLSEGDIARQLERIGSSIGLSPNEITVIERDLSKATYPKYDA